jgi:hypothetical protein
MKYAFDPCQHFVVLNKVAAFCGGYPAFHGRNELRLSLQVNTQDFLRQSVRVSTIARRNRLQFRFLFRSKWYFHEASLGSPQQRVNATLP